MNKNNTKYLMCDFETTVFKGQTYTEVWASASVELYTEDVHIFHSIGEQFEYFKSLKCNVVAYYHNLKFDGSFWLSYLLTDLHYTQAGWGKLPNEWHWNKNKEMASKTFKYSISNMGQWYTITIKVGNYFIEIRDSLKLLPFSVKRIGDSFGTKHKKLDMEYVGYRYAGCEITEEEKKYIANDVLVVKEALEKMFDEGHDKLTIGACCLSEYKNIINHTNAVGAFDYEELFPDLYAIPLDENLYGYPTVGDYIRRSYRGGWCYLVKGKENKKRNNGTTADVNSLYPSMMSSESGNVYPVSTPVFWKGNRIPDEALIKNRYYFLRIRTRFYIKEDKLPFIQIKHSGLYKSTEALITSDVVDPVTKRYCRYYKAEDGSVKDTTVEMVVTMTDYKLMLDHYNLVDFEILDGCYFNSMLGIFDAYIEKYKQQKLVSKGALREQAKLFLNNLYGKLASSQDSSFKVAFVKDDKSIGFMEVKEKNKKAGYIPCGSAITSYARNFTIRAAQENYYGVDKAGFIYADTDSIHCDLLPEQIKGIKVHDKNFCCWKLESCWDEAIFTRQKTYIEHVTHENLEPIDIPYYNIKCAGMPQRSKNLFEESLYGKEKDKDRNYTEDELKFLFDENDEPIKRTLNDFKVGLKVPDKLLPKRIKGGIVLVDTHYEMR